MHSDTKLLLTAGLPLLAMAAAAGAWIVHQRSPEVRVEKVRRDFMDLHMAMLFYGGDRCGIYLPPDSTRRLTSRQFRPGFETEASFSTRQRDFFGNQLTSWSPFTTPLAYVESIPGDPFRGGEPYGFLSWNMHDDKPVVAFLHSPGPDGVDDVDLWDLKQEFEREFACDTYDSRPAPGVKAAVRNMVLLHFYDPTNGTVSSGDIISVSYQNSKLFNFWRHGAGWLDAEYYSPAAARADELLRRGEDYEEGAPLPEPQLPWVRQQRAKSCYIPKNFVNRLQELGIDLTVQYTAADSEFWRAGAGRLGRDFAAVIESPGAWNQEAAEALAKWQREEPGFWHALSQLPSDLTPQQGGEEAGSRVPARSGSYLAIAPIVGKCLALAALGQAQRGDQEAAREYLAALHRVISLLPRGAVGVDPHAFRINQELERIHRETSEFLQSSKPALAAGK